MRISKFAFWYVVCLFLYYTIDRWSPLGNWNGNFGWPVHNDQASLDMFVCAALLGIAASFWWHFQPGMIIGSLLLGLWVYFHVQAWWIPYFFGVSSPQAIAFHSQFLSHVQVLPKIGNHFPPDAEHTFIDVFVFPTFAFCVLATVHSLKRKKKHPGGKPNRE